MYSQLQVATNIYIYNRSMHENNIIEFAVKTSFVMHIATVSISSYFSLTTLKHDVLLTNNRIFLLV